MITPYCHIPFRDIVKFQAEIDRYRFPLEIYLSASVLYATDPSEFTDTGKFLAEKGIPVMIHAPFLEMTPGGFDPRFRALTEKILLKAGEAACALGATGMVAHLGFEPWKHIFNIQEWDANALQTFNAVLQFFAGKAMTLFVENVYELTPERFEHLVAQNATTPLALCFDIAHHVLYSKAPLREWVSPLARYIRHIHLSDNHGNMDEHLPLGKGSIHFKEYFSLLQSFGVQPTFTFEFGGVEDILNSIELLNTFWNS